MIHAHHRKRRSQGGDDSPTNVIHIPDWFHSWIHDNVEKAQQLGLLVPGWQDPADVPITLPEDLISLKKPREKKERPKEKPRNRATIGVSVPKDEREDGAGLLDDRIQRGRELLCPVMGWEDNVPAYFVLIAVLDKGLEEIEYELKLEAMEEEEAALLADGEAAVDDLSVS